MPYALNPDDPGKELATYPTICASHELWRPNVYDTLTGPIADCSLIPQRYNARRFGVDLTPFPTLRQIEASCLARPEFDAARPEHQPDAPRDN
jgi:glutathione S-transferase